MSAQLPNLKFEVKNLGSVHRGEFCHKPLTVFCGPNNTGKTWTLYSLYHFYKNLTLIKAAYIDATDATPNLEDLNEFFSSELADFFNSYTFAVEGAQFGLIDSHDLESALAIAEETEIFLMPAERNGLHLLFRELSSRRTALLHHASRGTIDVNDLLRDVIYSRYAQPIADYIDWLNNLLEIQDEATGEFHRHAEHLKRNLAGGSYRVVPSTGSIEFRPYGSTTRGRRPAPLGLHITSSAVKSLFGLWFYLEYQAAPGNVLMIDEPELNIHPGKQRQIARLLARLVNAGINVVISTHSDYIIREFNSLIMLHQESGTRMRQRLKYREDEVLDPQRVGAYLFEDNTIQPLQTTQEDGIHATTFDEVITRMNTVNSDIYFNLRRARRADADD